MKCEFPVGERELVDFLSANAPKGVKIDHQNMVLLKRSSGETLLLAVLKGLEKIPPRQYATGVEIAYGYIDFPGQPKQMPPGCYLLRATARRLVEGFTDGVVEFLDEDRRCASSLPAQYRFFSLDIPRDPPGSGIEIAGSFGATNFDEDDDATAGRDDPLYIKCHENGGWICWRPWIDSL
jgi:hypothetical protein